MTRRLFDTPQIPPDGNTIFSMNRDNRPLNPMKTSLPLKAPSPPKPGISPVNRSLERGIDILRAFRPGSALLGNGEIAERTGLSKSTVSRLTQTLVASGLLQIEPGTRVYRLAPLVLSLAHAMRTGSRVLTIAAPLMRSAAEKHKINVGLAAPDQDEMVYLESIRYNRRPSLRTVVSGQRVPMELTSLGRAFFAIASHEQKENLFKHFSQVRSTQWPKLKIEIESAIKRYEEVGYCFASWQPEVVALATPIEIGPQIYALNVSVSAEGNPHDIVSELAPFLMDLRHKILKALSSG
jgi:DNA-binding IclR family transcriptional regulator